MKRAFSRVRHSKASTLCSKNKIRIWLESWATSVEQQEYCIIGDQDISVVHGEQKNPGSRGALDAHSGQKHKREEGGFAEEGEKTLVGLKKRTCKNGEIVEEGQLEEAIKNERAE